MVNDGTHLRCPILHVQPLDFVLAQEAEEHAWAQTRERPLAKAIAVDGLELCLGVRSHVVMLQRVKISSEPSSHET